LIEVLNEPGKPRFAVRDRFRINSFDGRQIGRNRRKK